MINLQKCFCFSQFYFQQLTALKSEKLPGITAVNRSNFSNLFLQNCFFPLSLSLLSFSSFFFLHLFLNSLCFFFFFGFVLPMFFLTILLRSKKKKIWLISTLFFSQKKKRRKFCVLLTYINFYASQQKNQTDYIDGVFFFFIYRYQLSLFFVILIKVERFYK